MENFISFYDQVDSLDILPKTEKRYLKKLYNKVSDITIGKYINNIDEELVHLNTLLSMIESSQKPNESIRAFIGADPKLPTEECIRDDYQRLMNDYFDSFGANKRPYQSSNQFNRLSAPGYFNNGVADITAKSIE